MNKRWTVGLGCVLALGFLTPAIALVVEGKNYPESATIEGKSLKLVGAGLREKWFFDVYTLGAYSESGPCDTATIVGKDEPKYLRIDMLRDVSAEKMSSTLGGSFADHMPKNASAELKKQRETFLSYFKDECSKGTRLEFFYLPGTGTVLKQNDKQLGEPMVGFDFARVLWDIYFGEDSCCSALKKQILESCGKKS